MAEKKKIAFVANCCVIGGVETSLINLLNIIDTKKYDITLYTNFGMNSVVGRIPKEIKCIDLDVYGIKEIYSKALQKYDWMTAIKTVKNYVCFRFCKRRYGKTKWLYKHLNFKDDEFDFVIAYNSGTSTIVISKEAFCSKKLILWEHGDFPYFDSEYIGALCTFDKCFCVSDYMKNRFLEYCSDMQEKTEVLYNVIDAKSIKDKAMEIVDYPLPTTKYTLVTVGRLSPEKGQVVIPEISKLLSKAKIDFSWYVIGDGADYQWIDNDIKEKGLEKRVVLMGAKDNPFPYVRNCTIYVQPSLSEGWCLTAQEARILHKPCVVTDIPVMHEQFIDGVNGIIANGTDANALYEGIMRLINSPELMENIIANLKSQPQDGTVEIQKLYDYIDS